MKNKKYCLFSAPHYFLDKKKIINSTDFFIIFDEIWQKKQIKTNQKISAWIVNPGQSFIINKKILNFFPNLKFLITPSTGVNHIDKTECSMRGIKIFSLLDKRKQLKSIRASSEFTFLLALNSIRRLDKAFKEVDNNRWRHKENFLRGREIFSKKVGIVGLGRIGSNLAKWFNSFGAKVFYYDPIVKNKTYVKKTIKDIFKICDLICICCSLTFKTQKLINLKFLLKMKKNSILVNSSRGEVINENDLIKFLKKRKDVFFTSDVLSGETRATHLKSKLVNYHKKRRVLLTPHIAGATIESQIKAATISINILKGL